MVQQGPNPSTSCARVVQRVYRKKTLSLPCLARRLWTPPRSSWAAAFLPGFPCMVRSARRPPASSTRPRGCAARRANPTFSPRRERRTRDRASPRQPARAPLPSPTPRPWRSPQIAAAPAEVRARPCPPAYALAFAQPSVLLPRRGRVRPRRSSTAAVQKQLRRSSLEDSSPEVCGSSLRCTEF